MLLELEEICFTYPGGGLPVLNKVSLGLQPGDRVALIGVNGAGKTTLLLHLNGLLRPTSGRVKWKGEDVSRPDYDRAAWRRQVGFVFQQPLHQLFAETVALEVGFGLKQLSLSRQAIELAIDRALSDMGLSSGYRNRSPFTLSHGEQRRLAIAAVLAMQPDLLVMDEATAGLDAGGTRFLLDKLKTMADSGLCIVLATHDLDAAAYWATRLLILSGRRLVYDGPARKAFRQPGLIASFGLDPPAPFSLLHYLETRGKGELAGELETVLLGEVTPEGET